MAIDITRILEEAIERGARAITSAVLVDTILRNARTLGSLEDPAAIMDIAKLITDEEIPTAAGVAAGFGKTGAFDFGIGLLLEHIIEPIVDARIKIPVEHAMNLAFPNKNMSERMLVSAVESGSASDAQLLDVLALQGIRPRQRQIIIAYAREKRLLKLAQARHTREAAEANLLSLEIDRALDKAEGEIKELEREISLLERERVTKPAAEEAAEVEKVIKQLERGIVALETAKIDSQIEKAARGLFPLVMA